MEKLINRWHSVLDMPKHDLTWHERDILDELAEFGESKGLIHRWSELSDVVYTYTRAKWSGFNEVKFPFKKRYFYVGLLYMIPKYSLRWKFFRILGKKFDKNLKIAAVRNPNKNQKLVAIATRYKIDPEQFKTEAEKLKKKWIFFK